MRITFRFLILLIPSLLGVVWGFLLAVQHLEKSWVMSDLSHRSRIVADSIQDSVQAGIARGDVNSLHKIFNRLTRDNRLAGLMVCSSDGVRLSKSDTLPDQVGCSGIGALADKDPVFVYLGNQLVHQAVYPIVDGNENLEGYTVLFHHPDYINNRVQLARQYMALAFLVLLLVVMVVTRLIYRWSVSKPIEQLGAALRTALRGGHPPKIAQNFENTEFEPLVKDLSKVISELKRSKTDQEVGNGNLWTPGRLRAEAQRLFGDSEMCVIANREPYIHNRKGSKIELLLPASGLVSAVEPILRACSGVWIGHGSGSADRETSDKNGRILVPPGKPEYVLKRVWLSREEERGHYYGFSNEGLWPLCHIAHTRPLFRKEDWIQYQNVNKKFAETFCLEMTAPKPIALIQDYHFALVPGLIRQMRPDAVTSLFWHIPWPNFEAIAICPWKNEILRGMLGADLIGFHTQYHCNNFLDAVDRFLEARVDRDNFSVTIQGHTCFVKPFPISIEWPTQHELPAEKIPEVRAQLLEELGLPKNSLVGIGVDRLDYTKGIVERFLAVERLLEKHPEFVGKFVFIQIGAPSRTQIKRYQDLNAEVKEVTDRINWKYSQPGYEPIVLRLSHHNAAEVFRYYRAADVCFVSSLHDGMNLVAKEFVASRGDLGGMLVLSSFTGAAKELRDALIVNPYDVEESAEALRTALLMPQEERQSRMQRLRNVVATNNVYHWAAQFIAEIHQISEGRAGLHQEKENESIGLRVDRKLSNFSAH